LGVLDVFFRLRQPQPAYNPNIIIVEINDENISKIGRWPWERKWHAAIVYALKELGAKHVFFDILFSEASNPDDDALLAESIKRAGNVYLPFAFPEDVIKFDNAIVPLKEFSDHARDMGSINVYPDIDGTIRRVPLFFNEGDKTYYHVSFEMAKACLGMEVEDIGPRRLVLAGRGKRLAVPILDNGQFLLNWTGGWKNTFKHYSFLNVLGAYDDLKNGIKPDIDLNDFRDSICLVGITAVGLYDIKAVPLEPAYPAIGVFATCLSNIMDGQFIRTAPVWVRWFLIVFLALLPAVSASGQKPLREVVTVLSYAPLFFTGSFLLFRLGIWVDCALPLVGFFATYSSVTLYNFIKTSVEKQRFFAMSITDELTRLYNIRYFKAVLRNECRVHENQMRNRFCIIMIDVDDFKSVNDVFGHKVGDMVLQEVADIIKSSSRSSDVVARYGGEEIVILLRGASLSTGMAFAEKVRKSIEDRVISGGDKTYSLTISLGVANFQERDTEDSVVKRADEGLYKAKNSGKNRVATVENEE